MEDQSQSRRNKGTKHNVSESSDQTIPMQVQESKPEASFEDLCWPIALRKGKRTCTQHPICKYVSYKKLFRPTKSFVVNVTNEKMLETFEEAKEDPK